MAMIRGIFRCFACKKRPEFHQGPGTLYLGGRLYKGTARGTLLLCNSCLATFTPEERARLAARGWRARPLSTYLRGAG